jgi:predicted ArsR family transcriptional regulator
MGAAAGWTFLTNHARLRDIAEAVGVTQRAVQLILDDLETTGYVRRTKVGRRNEYAVLGGPLRHPLEHGRAVDDLLDALGTEPPGPG